jgi:hypothetical protein
MSLPYNHLYFLKQFIIHQIHSKIFHPHLNDNWIFFIIRNPHFNRIIRICYDNYRNINGVTNLPWYDPRMSSSLKTLTDLHWYKSDRMEIQAMLYGVSELYKRENA